MCSPWQCYFAAWLQDEYEKGIKATSGVEKIGKYLLWWLDYLKMENFSDTCIDCVVSYLDDWI